ncbi:hypothetical protein ACH4OY_14900 [Micromonospora rubida]|uniref:Uncharacterized protein n=1 Tax=Micromonospora rubida TaxID=2697657 RepID=A0ABW7SPV0_9ACTN
MFSVTFPLLVPSSAVPFGEVTALRMRAAACWLAAIPGSYR